MAAGDRESVGSSTSCFYTPRYEDNGVRHRFITSLDELSDHRERWEDLRRRCGGSLSSSYPLAIAWLEAHDDMVRPCVALIEDGEELVGIAPLASQEYSIHGLRVRTRSMIGDLREKLGLSDLGILCEAGRRDAVAEMFSSLKRDRWNVLRLNLLMSGKANYQLLEMARSSWDCQEMPEASTTILDLPGSGDIEECFGKKTRENVRRDVRRLERDTALQFRSVGEGELDRSIDKYVELHTQRWSMRGGSLFQDADNVAFLKRSMATAFRNGFGHAYELVIDGEVAAQCFGFQEGSSGWGYRTGMDDRFAKYSPGKVLILKTLTDLRDKGIRQFNAGYGNESYKRSLGGRDVSLHGIQARRGTISALARLANAPALQRLDRALGLREKAFGDVYR